MKAYPTQQNRLAKLVSSAALITATMLGLGGSLFAQSSWTWNGAGSTWNNNANWNTGANGPVGASTRPQGYLNFAGSANLTANNDYTAYGPAFQMYFNSGAGAFTITGNPLKFYDYGAAGNPVIANDSTNLQTVNIIFGIGNTSGGTSFNINPNSGDLSFGTASGNVFAYFDDKGLPLTINGNTGHTVTFWGAINNGAATTALTLAQNSTVVLKTVNGYTGNTTLSAGTLSLANGASISNTPSISIAAGATFDVSGISSFALSSSTSLSASGTGTTVGSTAATIKGASGGTVNLGSRPITLTYNGTSPALYVSQGTLTLSGNAFTVNGTTLGSGTYTLVQQASGTISGSGSFAVSGTAIPSGKLALISVSGGSVLLSIGNSASSTFSSSSTWTCPTGVNSVQVECWGGGGAGGTACRPGSTTATGGGGAGGAYSKVTSMSVTPGTTYTVTIGAGGVSSTNDTAKVAGGDTWFNSSSLILAKGGAGGENVFAATGRFGIGGTGSTTGCIGDVKNAGGNGATSTSANFGGGGGGSAGTAGAGNAPASTTLGLGATAVTGGGTGGNANATLGSSGPGQSPTTPPGGGGGGARSSSSTVQLGGTGGAGQVVLTYVVPGAIYRANTSGNLNTSGDWVGGVVPTSANYAAWDSTVSTPANCTAALGADLSWRGISIAAPSTNVVISSGNTLTLGAATSIPSTFANGIDMSGASQNLTLNCGVSIAPGDQRWSVASGKTLDASAITVSHAVGSTVDFSSTGTIKVGNANANGILGGWATVGSDGWATVSSSTVSALGTYVAGASYTLTTDNIDVTTTGAASSIAGVGSIRYSANPSGFKINSAGSPMAVGSGGILVRNGNAASLLSSATTASLRELRGSSGGDLVLQVVGSGSLVLGGNTAGNAATQNSPITISDNGSATGLTKSGLGTAVLYGTNASTGNFRINQGTFAMATFNNGTVSAMPSTPSIYVESGATFDVATNGGFTLSAGQTLSGLGSVFGSITVANSATAVVNPGNNGTTPAYGTLTFKSNLTFGASSKVQFDLSTNSASGNDKIVLDLASAALNGGGATVTINPISGTAALATSDYVLFDLTGASATVASSFAPAPSWVSTPANSANFSVVTIGKQVLLHYTPAPSAANSTATASPSTGVASDNTATSTITVTAKDAGNAVVSNALVTVSSSGTGNTLSTPAITDVNGQTTFTIKSTKAETKTITITIAGTQITAQPTVVFVPGAVSVANSTATASPSTGVTADGTTTSTITVVAKDVNNNLISGATVTGSSTGSGNTVSSAANTDGTGTSTFTIKSTVAETKTISVAIAGTTITAQPTVAFVPGAVSAANSTATASPTTVSANGTATSTITVTAKDANNNLISGAAVTVASTGSGNTLSSPANTDVNGQTTFTIASTVPELKTITVTIAGTDITQQPTVSFQISVSPSLSTAVASPTSGVTADGSSTSTITVTAISTDANPIPGATVTASSTGTGNTFSTAAATDGSGQTTLTIKSTKAETKTITVSINGTPISQQPTVTFVPGTVAAANSTIGPATATNVADGASTQVITVIARDVNNNSLALGGATVVFSATAGTMGTTTDNGNGSYSATWTAPTSVGSGTATITATLGGTAVGTGVGASSSLITLTAGAATQVVVETAANGTGAVVPSQTIYSGNSITVFAVSRDANGNFVGNVAADTNGWSLTSVTGGLVAGDLVASGDRKSAIFTGHLAGSAAIHVISTNLTPVDSGTVTVIQPYFKSATNGNWNAASTWLQSDTANGTYSTTTNTPNSTSAAGVVIQSAHNVTVTASVAVDHVTVSSGGTLTVNSGVTLTVAKSTGTDLDVSGTVVNSGTIATTASPVIVFEAGALYQHNQNAGTIPTSTWNLTSTCEITGSVGSTTGPGGLGQTFGTFKWNSPGQNTTCNLAGTLTNVAGDFIVANTGGQILRGAGSAGVILNIGGSLKITITNGVYSLGNNNPTLTKYIIAGNIEISSGGVLDYKEAGTSGGTYQIDLSGDLIIHGTGKLQKSNTSTAAFNFVKSGTQVVAIDSTASTSGNINWTVSGNTTLDLGSSVIAGSSGTFLTSPGSTLRIGHPQGISTTSGTGNIQVTGTKTYDGAGNYAYTGTTAQDTGSALPTTTGNVTILNTNGIVTLHSTATVNTPGKFTVASGAYLQFVTDSVQGTGEFVLQAGATLGVDNQAGLRALPNITGGNVRTATKTYDPAANFVLLNSPSAQTTGDGFPAVVNNLTIANTAFPVTLSSNILVNGTFTENSGVALDFGSRTITTSNSPALNGAMTMEVTRTGANTFSGSKLTVNSPGTLTYGGSLTVTLLGGTLAEGDAIPLFSAPSYSGALTITAAPTQVGLNRSDAQLTGGTGGSLSYTCDNSLIATGAANTAICNGGSYALGGGATGGSGSYASFAWISIPAGFTSASANPTVSPTVTTIYHLTVTDSVGCTASKDVLVTVNPTPSVSVNSPAVCAGSSATLTATTGASSPSYLWSPGGATTASITVSPSSNTTYSVTVTDGATGCTGSGSGTVTVNPLPTVAVNSATNCPNSPVTLTATSSAASPSYLWSPGGATTASISVSPSATTTYSVTVTDGTTGCSDTGSGTVTVTQSVPVISFYFTNATLNVDSNCSVSMPDVTGTNYIVASDSCSSVTIYQSPTNGAALSLGTNLVVLTVSNDFGTLAYSTNTITVVDTTAPVITLLGSNPATVECHSGYIDAGATAADNCTLASLTTNGVVDANTPGSYTVTYVATDASGNSSTNTRTVTVSDTTVPVVTLNGSSTMTVECHGTFTDPGATANDACAGSLTPSVSGSVNVNMPGIYTLTYTAMDPSGNSGSANRTVTVSDTLAPVISYNFTNLVLSVDTNCSALMPDVTGTNYIIASDACSGSALTITQTPTNNSVLALGTNVVVIAVSDVSGNTSYSTNTIVVRDTIAPVVTLIGSSTVTVECHGSYTELGATATDNCTLASLTTNGVVDANTPGSYVVTYVATDASGNSSTNARTVTVSDTTVPVVTLNGSSTMTVECHGSFSDPGASASDACAGSLSVSTSGSVDTTTPGMYHLTYSATDPSGNTGSAMRTVTVSDTTAPVISYNFTNLNLSVDTNCSVLMPDVTGTNYIIASDACSGSALTITQSPTNNAVLPLGTNVVVIAVADVSGNTAYSTNTIVVRDTTAPVITLIGSAVTVECHSSYVELGAIATDNCTLASLTTNGVVDANTPGSYVVTYVATDASGNSSTNTRTVTVSDTTAPVISHIPSTQSISLGTNCTAALPDYTGSVIASDACSGSVTIRQLPVAGTILALGANTVMFSVDDGNGNTNTASLLVVVSDTTAPVITSQPQSVTNGIGTTASFSVAATSCSALSYQWFKGTGSLADMTNATLTISPVSVSDAGTYHVTVTSVAGSTTSSYATLTVPFELPVIDSETILSDGSFQLIFHAAAGQTYTVLGSEDSSADLSSWTSLATGTFGTTNAVYIDNTVGTHGKRFFSIKTP